jgi:hypothetical protein
MMDHYTIEHMVQLVTKALNEQNIVFNKVNATVKSETPHHMNVSISVTFPPRADKHNYPYESQAAINFKGAPTGCGLVIMHGHAYFAGTHNEDSMIVVAKAIMQHYKKDGAGTVMASQGGKQYEKCPVLEKLGFVNVTTYDNLAHSYANDKQSIWVHSFKRGE